MDENTNVENLRKWRSQVEHELEETQEGLLLHQRKLRESKDRLELIDRLLALEGEVVSKSTQSPTSPAEFLDACEGIMREVGKPMHIGDIQIALIENGIPIPGKGTQANVISRLQRSDGRFIRTGRGMYGLPEFGYPEVKPVRRRRRSSTKHKR